MKALHAYLSIPLSSDGRLICYSLGKPLLMLGILLSWPWPKIGGGSFLLACTLFLIGLAWVNRYSIMAVILGGIVGLLGYTMWYPAYEKTQHITAAGEGILWIIGILSIVAAHCGILGILSVAKRT